MVSFCLLQGNYKGYDLPDAWRVRDFFERLMEEGVIQQKDWEWLRRRPPRYEKQIRELGFDYERLSKIIEKLTNAGTLSK